MPSFDVVSEVDMQEADNAINQVTKEIATRYDLKNSKCTIELDKLKKQLSITADDKLKLAAVTEILNQKMVKRGIGVKALDYKEPEAASGGTLKQTVAIKHGIQTDDAKNIVKIIKEQKLKKTQAQIQQEQVRVTSPSRDELQEVIKLLKDKVNLELQFVNFKD